MEEAFNAVGALHVAAFNVVKVGTDDQAELLPVQRVYTAHW
jgi:hypothetical protein